MLKLISIALLATLFLSSCAPISRTLQLPGRIVKATGRTLGF